MMKMKLKMRRQHAKHFNYNYELVFVIIMCQLSITKSDFNVVIPELCTIPETIHVNLTWIHEMVQSGIHQHHQQQQQHDEQVLRQSQFKLNILGPEEICDGSQGLLKFVSMAYADPSGQMIASLDPHLCPTAATFCHLRHKQFISWTCEKRPGVLSLKPTAMEVVTAIQRLIKYFDWEHIIFTKSKSDSSPYCDEIGTLLQQQLELEIQHNQESHGKNSDSNHKNHHNNATVFLLGNFEDLGQLQLFSSNTNTVLNNNVDGLFICMSYASGLSFNNNLFGKKASATFNQLKKQLDKNPARRGEKLPLILIPEWPLPIETLHPYVPALAVVTDLYSFPYPTSSPSVEYESTSSSSSSSSGNSGSGSWSSINTGNGEYYFGDSLKSVTKLLEKLFAQMILKSVKVGLDLMEHQNKYETTTQQQHHPSSSLPSSSSSSSSPSSSTTKFHHFGSAPSKLHQQQQQPFYFSVVHYDKGRWHTLINLSSEDKLPSFRSSKSTTRERDIFTMSRLLNSNYGNGRDGRHSPEDLLNWMHIVLGIGVTILIVLSTICASIYCRGTSTRRFYGANISQRKLSKRQRSQGPYKIILTSQDVIFGGPAATTTLTGSTTFPNTNTTSAPAPALCNSVSTAVAVAAGTTGIASEVVIDESGTTPSGTGAKIPGRLPQFNSITRDGLSGGEEEKPDLLKGSFGTLRKGSSATNLNELFGEPREYRARYKGDMVHLRRLETSSESLQIKTKAMGILETLHGLRHENVNAMLGCLTQGIPSLVWEYCSRGSLHDIIQQTDIKLDWAFKLSLLTDLVRGMRYLHQSLVRVHGSLSSHNCVVDARWVLKVTDFGLPTFYEAQGLLSRERSAKELLWRAPELLRDEHHGRKAGGTQAGDVYSFAIIVQEVLVRGEPYCMLTLSPEEILEKVKRPPPLIRPSVSKGVAPPEAINIMRQCWAELPDMRPDFNMIHDLFKTLNHGRKANIVDTMFQMLEKYSNNLEELIRERTEQLDLEKKKTEQLLNRMLPSTVAEKLKFGLPVDPEEFSEVTIYFSDIVGFTTISAYSTPFEVVDLLNDLYTCFDATINDYNVYKVETIGDAYMVVGGAPVWSIDHADQIATMALDLLHQSGKFVIRHLPFTPLRVRIGLHTGPCCAGVVGLTMPRYCLFGDTVCVASRMESTGSAWRIHISAETKTKLESIGGYIIQCRGMTDIKGKGQMPTFWLSGKEGFNKELPKPPGPNESVQLDEKMITFGRTGIRPETIVRCASINDEIDGNINGASVGLPKYPVAKPKYGHFTGDNANRGLSPAEQVAHQLLNGRPASRGLRRQFSLDQGTHVHPLVSANNSFRKAPSLEDRNNTLHPARSSIVLNREESSSEHLLINSISAVTVPGSLSLAPTATAMSLTSPSITASNSLKSSFTSPNVSTSTIEPILEVVSNPTTPIPPESCNNSTDSTDSYDTCIHQQFENMTTGNHNNNFSSTSGSGSFLHTCQKSTGSSSCSSPNSKPQVLVMLKESPKSD